MKCVKKKEERMIIEGRGHADTTIKWITEEGRGEGGNGSANDDTMTTKTTTMKPRSDHGCGGGEWQAPAMAVTVAAVVTRGCFCNKIRHPR